MHLTKTGDGLFTNEMVDSVLVSQDGFIRAAALLYANGHDPQYMRDINAPETKEYHDEIARFFDLHLAR